MSNVNGKAEHLIRAALKGIEKEPSTWNQAFWCSASITQGCGTTYCIGGWMLLYDGWTHTGDGFRFSKGDRTIKDPYEGFLADLVYGDNSPELGKTIFSERLRTFDALVEHVEDTLEINFEEDCPCLTEQDLCILQGCPCGVHTAALETSPSTLLEIHNPLMKVIEDLVAQCAKAGDPIFITQVLEDKPLMAALRAAFMAGETSLIQTVTRKAERRIAEVRLQLQEMTQSRDRAVGHNSTLQREIANLQKELSAVGAEPGENLAPWERDQVIRSLQGQVDQLRDGSRRTPEFRKMKAAVNRLEQENAALRLNNTSLVMQTRATQGQLIEQKRVVATMQAPRDITQARQEGFKIAVDAWQKALDIVKSQERL